MRVCAILRLCFLVLRYVLRINTFYYYLFHVFWYLSQRAVCNTEHF